MTQLIVEHPLYPLLQMVFHKCELATCSPRDAQTETVCSSDSFSEDIRNFINEARLHNLPLTTGSDDVDKFMLKSIGVLRMHLLELEKVHQLCDNFCSRYINCLKGKLPIDLVVDESSARNGSNPQDGSSSNNSNNNDSSNNSTNNLSSSAASQTNGQTNNNTQNNNTQNNNNNTDNNNTSATSNTSNDRTRNSSSSTSHHHQNSNNHHHHQQQQHQSHQHQQHHHHHLHHQHPSQAQQQIQQSHHQDASSLAAQVGNPNGYNPADPYHQAAVASSYGYSSNPYAAYHAATSSTNNNSNHTTSNSNSNNNNGNNNHRDLTGSSGSSSASSIKVEHGANGGGQFGADRQQLHDEVRSPTGSTGSFLGDASLGSGDGTECEDDDNRGKRQQKKRGIFPKAATNIMRAWLFQHLNHPYPSEDQKKQLAEETGLTILQVNNWFINARRRIVQPMIDQSNRTSGNIMAGPAYSPDAASMGYMLDSSQTFRSLPGVESAGMGPLASHAAMTSAMGAYSAASAQHLSQHYGRQQQQHAAMALGLSTPPTGPHSMMGDHSALPPPYYH